ncbi:YeeE/YedE family protein [Rhodobium gokarnense]|nr:YeeE/YedE family protein [Rhodobium gokarnense]
MVPARTRRACVFGKVPATESRSRPRQIGGRMDLFKKTLDPVIALAAIAVLDIFLFLIVGSWTVGGGETMMTGLAAEAVLGDDIERLPFWSLVFQPDWGYWKIYISLGMLFGAFVAAVLSKEFYLRMPRRLGEWVMITIGGLLMGIGIRLAFICNVSTFFGITPEVNFGGYLAISGIIAGAWVGSLIYKRILEG